MTKTFYTSDLHFMHKRICEFTDRKSFTDAERHTEWLIDIWNTQVSKSDIVYHLGDFSFANKAVDTAVILDKLNGSKHLIKGNHDRTKDMEELRKLNKCSWFGDYKEVKIADNPVVLFHFPIASWHKQHLGAFHLHGHSHGSYTTEFGKILDVGIDSAFNILGSHRLFTEKDVLEYMHNRDVHVVDHHKERNP